MYKAKKFISYMALCVLIFSLCACGEKGSENAAIYGETVGELEDNELFAIIDTNASLPVLLVTSQVYNDGLGNQAALNCDVYYLIDKEVKNIGTIESMGTAYPIAYDETGIYAACQVIPKLEFPYFYPHFSAFTGSAINNFQKITKI